MIVAGRKYCPKCKQDKPVAEFSAERKRGDGLRGLCKVCDRQNTSAWMKKNRAKQTQKMREYRKARPEYFAQYRLERKPKDIFLRARSRASARNIPFNLTPEDIVVEKYCPMIGCGVELVYGKGVQVKASASLDRIVPSLGYVKGNVIIICASCNRRKYDHTPETARNLVAFFERFGY